MVYEPEEDSFFLKTFVEKLAIGRVLDLGTGSGIQAMAAAARREVREVVAADIDEEAVTLVKKKKIAKISAVRSNLFSNIKGLFDTIIFNPPYLPDDEQHMDAALDGGAEGYEIIGRFLADAKRHLAERGFILLLFSNRTGKDMVDSIISNEHYSAELLGRKSLPFFEELYVYRVVPRKEREIFAHGKRGLIYIEGDVCIKEKNPDSAVDTLKNEAEFLKILNRKNIGPKLIKYEDKKLYREFIEGEPLGKFLAKEEDKRKIISVLLQILEQCRKIDLLGINKTELTNPYKDIIITPENKAVLIDFERCKMTEKPKNVTQFLQYIAKNSALLSAKGIILDRNRIILLGKRYKDSSSSASFSNISDLFSCCLGSPDMSPPI
ncbi:MAG: HemK2/MTQ2 family protein methyltransferase [archaeon]